MPCISGLLLNTLGGVIRLKAKGQATSVIREVQKSLQNAWPAVSYCYSEMEFINKNKRKKSASRIYWLLFTDLCHQ